MEQTNDLELKDSYAFIKYLPEIKSILSFEQEGEFSPNSWIEVGKIIGMNPLEAALKYHQWQIELLRMNKTEHRKKNRGLTDTEKELINKYRMEFHVKDIAQMIHRPKTTVQNYLYINGLEYKREKAKKFDFDDEHNLIIFKNMNKPRRIIAKKVGCTVDQLSSYMTRKFFREVLPTLNKKD